MEPEFIESREQSAKDPPSVLIVEDDDSSRHALRQLLSVYGYRARAFASAEEALSALNEGAMPPIALIDLDLPGMNGLDLISRLEDLDPMVYPVLITAADPERLAINCKGRNVTYLRKPLNVERLLTILGEREPAS